MRIRRIATLLVCLAAAACVDESPVYPEPPLIDPLPPHFVLVAGDRHAALLVARNGMLANMVMPPEDYEARRTGSAPSYSVRGLARMVYDRGLPDEFDFAVFAYDPGQPRSYASGIEYGALINNRITGTSLPPMSRGIIERGQSPVTVEPIDTERLRYATLLGDARQLRDELLHRFAHAWGRPGNAPLRNAAHWTFSGIGGQLGGWVTGTLDTVAPGVYRALGPTGEPFDPEGISLGARAPYSPVELYLMGLLPYDSVPAYDLAFGGRWLDAAARTFTADSIRRTTAFDDRGPFTRLRDPAPESAPNHFRGVLVVVSARPLDSNTVALLSQELEQFGRAGPDDRDDMFNFREATGGRGTLTFGGLTQALERD